MQGWSRSEGSMQLSGMGRRTCSWAWGIAGSAEFSCCRKGISRTFERKTWQTIQELDGKGVILGIKNDHFPEIKTKPATSFSIAEQDTSKYQQYDTPT